MSVPNQKKIYIERSSENVRKDYLKVSNDSLTAAMYTLKPSTFKLWVYFADNANGYAMDLYPIDFCTRANLSRSTYDRSFKELEDNGYIIHSSKQDNLYMFKEISDKAKMPDSISSLDTEAFESIKDKFFAEDEGEL